MASFPPALQRLISQFARLPSLGEKSATRLAYYLVQGNKELAKSLAAALVDAAEKVRACDQCYFMSESSLCVICAAGNRDRSQLCVVEKPIDVIAIERVGEFRGLYHVLHGLWAPLRGVGAENIRLAELLQRVGQGEVKEVILATNVTVEGDATAMYIARLLMERGIKTTRLAQGMPRGGELEYADDLTLSRAFSGRNAIQG